MSCANSDNVKCFSAPDLCAIADFNALDFRIRTTVPEHSIVLIRQARAPGIDPPRSVWLPRWLYVLLGVQAVVLIGFGIALFITPVPTAPLWPWKLTTLVAQATASWLIALGVAAAQALMERDARRLLPASAGYLSLGILELIVLARYPHQFRWGSAPGVVYLVFLGTILVAGAVGLARGLRPSVGPAIEQRPPLPAQAP